MRTQYLLAALLVASAGCEDLHSGQGPSDPPGPAKLMRVTVQDSVPFGARMAAVDLLDTSGSPLSTAVACDDVNPCLAPFTLDGVVPDITCHGGMCIDPLRAGLAPISPPAPNRTGGLGGSQIRVVFNKLLSDGVEKTPGLIEVDDWTGAPVAGMTYWDPTGGLTSPDPLRAPFGPAIVFKPNASLAPHATYTIKLAAGLHDRAGNPVADQSGNVLAGPFSLAFTTEDLAMIGATTTTDVTTPGVSLTADEILQIGFNGGVNTATVSCTATSGGTTVAVQAFSEAGASCQGATPDATVLDLVATNGSAAIDWPAGSYSISCTGKDNATGNSTFQLAGTFTVAGAAVANDPRSRAQHAICN